MKDGELFFDKKIRVNYLHKNGSIVSAVGK
jgi:hypothetical protein